MTSPDIDMTAVDSYLAAGADQGMIASLVDMGILPQGDLTGLGSLSVRAGCLGLADRCPHERRHGSVATRQSRPTRWPLIWPPRRARSRANSAPICPARQRNSLISSRTLLALLSF